MTQTYKDLAKAEKPLLKTLPAVNRIIVIGCGGTGSQLVPDLIRAYKFGNNKRGNDGITLVDGDTVETKNIERQNFILKDVGKNKAEVLAKRYGQVFGIPVKFRDKKIETQNDILNLINYDRRSGDYRSQNDIDIIISCADNHYVRRLIHEAFVMLDQHILWIDSGNEDKFGQVICGFQPRDEMRYGHAAKSTLREKIIRDWIKYGNLHGTGRAPMPSVCEMFPEIRVAIPPSEEIESCAEVAVTRPQNILINRMAATALMSYLYPCLYAYNEENEDGLITRTNTLTHHMTLFNISGEFSKKIMLASEFKAVFKGVYDDLESE